MDIANKLLEETLKRLEATEDFILKEAPELCKEIIRECYIDGITKSLTALFFIAISACISIYLYLKIGGYDEPIRDSYGYTTNKKEMEYFFLWLFFVSSIIFEMAQLYNIFRYINLMFTAWYCPKLYITRGLKYLVRSESS